MRYVDTETEPLAYPHTSASGYSGGDLLDTGWDLHWAGPGRVYLDDRDIADILTAALGRDLVTEVLTGNGWTPPDTTPARVAELEQALELANGLLEAAHTENDGLLAVLRRTAPDLADEAAATSAAEAAVAESPAG